MSGTKTSRACFAAGGIGKRKLRILIVDDHPIVRQGLRRLIEHEKDLTICGEAESADRGMVCIEELKPDFAIVDVSMKGRSGIDMIKDIRVQGYTFPILVLSVHDDAVYAERALRAGAQGYIVKHEAPDLIVTAIRKILEGDIYVYEKIATKLLAKLANADLALDSPVACLSDRELEILELIGRGQTSIEIAEVLSLSLSTIETHRAAIKRKLKLDTAAEMSTFATEWLAGES